MTGDRPLSTWQKLWLSFSRRFRDSGFWFGVAIALIWPFALFGTFFMVSKSGAIAMKPSAANWSATLRTQFDNPKIS